MALEFGQHGDVVYERAPLTFVLCQVKFSPIMSLGSPAGIAGFQTAIRGEYPILLPPEQSASVQVGPVTSMSISPPVWKLTDEESTWTVGIAVDFVSLETPHYSSIDDFLARFDRVLTALHRTLRPSPSIRVGMRKVNLIQAPIDNDVASFAAAIRPEILGPLAVTTWPTEVVGSASQLHFSDGDDAGLIARWGLGRDDAGTLGFVLDLDYFTERPFQVDGGDALTTTLRHFSDGMTSFFEWAIVDEYKLSFQPRPRALSEESK